MDSKYYRCHVLDADGFGTCYKSTDDCGKICESDDTFITAHYGSFHYHLNRCQVIVFDNFIKEHFRTMKKRTSSIG